MSTHRPGRLAWESHYPVSVRLRKTSWYWQLAHWLVKDTQSPPTGAFQSSGGSGAQNDRTESDTHGAGEERGQDHKAKRSPITNQGIRVGKVWCRHHVPGSQIISSLLRRTLWKNLADLDQDMGQCCNPFLQNKWMTSYSLPRPVHPPHVSPPPFYAHSTN